VLGTFACRRSSTSLSCGPRELRGPYSCSLHCMLLHKRSASFTLLPYSEDRYTSVMTSLFYRLECVDHGVLPLAPACKCSLVLATSSHTHPLDPYTPPTRLETPYQLFDCFGKLLTNHLPFVPRLESTPRRRRCCASIQRVLNYPENRPRRLTVPFTLTTSPFNNDKTRITGWPKPVSCSEGGGG